MMLDKNDYLTFIQALDFWDKLTKNQQQLLAKDARVFHYEKGMTLHSGDMDCLGMLFVKSGSLRVYMLSDEGREITLYRLDDGELCILSASCVLSSITFDVHIEAQSDCDVFLVNAHVLSTLSAENIYVECFTYRMATERFSDVMWAMQQILFISFDKRLASFLIDETTRVHSDTLSMTHEEIAKLLGSAREVVSRMLKYFAKEGYVQLSRGTVTLSNKMALLKLIG